MAHDSDSDDDVANSTRMKMPGAVPAAGVPAASAPAAATPAAAAPAAAALAAAQPSHILAGYMSPAAKLLRDAQQQSLTKAATKSARFTALDMDDDLLAAVVAAPAAVPDPTPKSSIPALTESSGRDAVAVALGSAPPAVPAVAATQGATRVPLAAPGLLAASPAPRISSRFLAFDD